MSGPPKKASPAPVAADGEALVAVPRMNRPANASSKPLCDKPKLTVRVANDGPPITVTGREAQTLALLIRQGIRGFTSGEASPMHWARRTSAYIHNLKRAGVPVSKVLEPTPDGARVARYALAGPVAVVNGGEA